MHFVDKKGHLSTVVEKPKGGPLGSGTRGPQFRQVTTTCWPSCCLLQPPNIVFNYWKFVFSRTHLIQGVGEPSYVVSGKRERTEQPDVACIAFYLLLHNERSRHSSSG
jgi:hypothetical protein